MAAKGTLDEYTKMRDVHYEDNWRLQKILKADTEALERDRYDRANYLRVAHNIIALAEALKTEHKLSQTAFLNFKSMEDK
tara:strand:- start:818 stop:1057 length:240 start_codon:yes stop_codon:yes gene_type:complete